MKRLRIVSIGATVAAMLAATGARADYESPEQTGLPGALPKSPSDLGKCEGCSQALPPLSVN